MTGCALLGGVAQGTKPEVRTYNTIISACNRSGQPEQALRVYERMLADGAQPTATTYTALISAYGKTGKARELQRAMCHMMVTMSEWPRQAHAPADACAHVPASACGVDGAHH